MWKRKKRGEWWKWDCEKGRGGRNGVEIRRELLCWRAGDGSGGESCSGGWTHDVGLLCACALRLLRGTLCVKVRRGREEERKEGRARQAGRKNALTAIRCERRYVLFVKGRGIRRPKGGGKSVNNQGTPTAYIKAKPLESSLLCLNFPLLYASAILACLLLQFCWLRKDKLQNRRWPSPLLLCDLPSSFCVCVCLTWRVSFHSEAIVTQTGHVCLCLCLCLCIVVDGCCCCQRKEEREQDLQANGVSIFHIHQIHFSFFHLVFTSVSLFSLTLVSLSSRHLYLFFPFPLTFFSPLLCRSFVRVPKSFLCKRFFVFVVWICPRSPLHPIFFLYFWDSELQHDDMGRASFLLSFAFVPLFISNARKCKQ